MADYRRLARQKAIKYGLDPQVFARQINAESGYNPSARSPAGAQGIAQIMPGTAQSWHVNASDPVAALDAAAKHMAQYVKQFGYRNALVAYNAGPGAVGGKLPAETQNYIKTILGGTTPKAPTSYPASPASPKPVSLPSAGPDKTQLALSLLGMGGGYGGGGDPLTTALLQVAQQQKGSYGPAPQAGGPSPSRVGNAVVGSPIAGMKPHGATHETAGLPGYPAYDYMAKAGTPVVAPVSGKIIKLSGHDPRSGPTSGPHGPFGWSIYVQGDNGKTYFLTHLGSRNVNVGQRVRQGAVIGSIGNYAKYGGADHVHVGVHG